MNIEQALDEQAVAGITSHMNEDHSDALVLYLRTYANIDTSDVTNVQMTGIDHAGIDIIYSSAGKNHNVRINYADCGFNTTVDSRPAARAMLVEMVNAAST